MILTPLDTMKINPGILVGTIGLAGLTAGVGISLGLAALQANRATQSQPSLAPPQPSPAAVPVTALETAATQPSATPLMLSQAENDYLYDLSQTLQKPEIDRAAQAEKLAIGRQVCGWLEGGADFWGVRSQFDQQYSRAIAGEYGFNRDAYIKFAAERLCFQYAATASIQPPQVIIETQTVREEVPVFIREKAEVPVPEPYPVPVPLPHPRPPIPLPTPIPSPVPLPTPIPFPPPSPQPSPSPEPLPLPDPLPDPSPVPDPSPPSQPDSPLQSGQEI